ncbi:hypothetical protein CR513_21726, partial [Mucuna pruriens]
MVLVKKYNGKWQMCVNYSGLNKACPQNSYLLPNIDRLVDRASSFQVFSFLDAYSTNKIAFMMNRPTYYYQVMSFDLKNAGATYKRLMDKVFANHISHNLEVFVDDMVMKSNILERHINDLEETFT